ncbi:MAG: cation transporter [Desulfomonile tiedjei]|nr:cation transporter [Desulfomonile tiedjei]
MAHEHHHHHAHDGSGETRLGIALLITAGYMAAEIVGGILFNSLALLADAGHMLSDVMALALSWVALHIGKRSPTDRHTYGFKRTEILAALINGLALWVIVAVIFYESVHRFLTPAPVAGVGMLVVASVGLAVNLAMAALLFGTREHNLNLKGAFLHVLSDALGSVGAIIAAIVILATAAYWADPLVSVLIGLLILYSSWGLLKEAVNILMEGVPSGVDIKHIEDALLDHGGVCCVYDLHVWSITSNRVAMSAHVVLAEPDGNRVEVLRGLEKLLADRFNITHTTIQVEATHEMLPESDSLICRGGTMCGSVH